MQQAKPAFRNQFKEYLQRGGIDFDLLSERQRSIHMTRFYVNEILRQLRAGLFPDDPEDIENCFVDGSGDRGIDFIFRSDDGFVLVIQSKYRSSDKSEKIEDVESFCQVLRKHHPKSGGALKKHQRVLEAVSDIDWDHDKFELQFITLGKVSDDIRKYADTNLAYLPDVPGIDDRTETVILGEQNLNEALRDAISTGESLTHPVPVRFSADAEGTPWLVHESEDGVRSFIGTIKAAQLRELYSNSATRNRLFSMNIRNYIGDTSTNKGMIETAIKKPMEFFFYNNGLSAVATKITENPKQATLECERFSIINGAQTVRSLAKAHAKNPTSVRQADVMIRISEIPRKQDEFLVNVTRFNNTQNSIKVSDFRSNDPVQLGLAARFKELQRSGKKFAYRNKRSEREANKIAIGMEEFAKAIFSFRFGPADAFGGTAYLFDTDREKGYVRVFGDGTNVWTTVSKEEFEVLAGSWFLCEQVRSLLPAEKENLAAKEIERIEANPKVKEIPVVKDALERRWMVFFVVGEMLRVKYASPAKLDANLRKLANPLWTEKDGPEKEVLRKYTKAACEILVRTYRNASKSSEFMHRNWFRDKKTIEDLRTEVSLSETVLEILPFLRKSTT